MILLYVFIELHYLSSPQFDRTLRILKISVSQRPSLMTIIYEKENHE